MIDLSKPWPFGLSRRSAPWVTLGFAVLIIALHWLDRPISAWGQGLPDGVRAFFHWVTAWGSDWVPISLFVAWLAAWLLSLLTRDNLQRALRELAALSGFIFLGVSLPGLVTILLKRIIGRGRPVTWSVDAPLSFHSLNWNAYDYQSFPSGHATTAFSLAAVVALVWPKALWPAMALAAAVAVSRIVLGEHYPTDVTAGAVLGILGAYAARQLFVARGWLFAANADGGIERRRFAALNALLVRP